jgi:hypothetical protein
VLHEGPAQRCGARLDHVHGADRAFVGQRAGELWFDAFALDDGRRFRPPEDRCRAPAPAARALQPLQERRAPGVDEGTPHGHVLAPNAQFGMWLPEARPPHFGSSSKTRSMRSISVSPSRASTTAGCGERSKSPRGASRDVGRSPSHCWDRRWGSAPGMGRGVGLTSSAARWRRRCPSGLLLVSGPARRPCLPRSGGQRSHGGLLTRPAAERGSGLALLPPQGAQRRCSARVPGRVRRARGGATMLFWRGYEPKSRLWSEGTRDQGEGHRVVNGH